MNPELSEDETVPQSVKASCFQRWKQNPSMWFSPAWFNDWKTALKSSWKVWKYTKREGSIYVFSSICSDAKYVVAGLAYWLNSAGFFTWGKTAVLKIASWIGGAIATAAAIFSNTV